MRETAGSLTEVAGTAAGEGARRATPRPRTAIRGPVGGSAAEHLSSSIRESPRQATRATDIVRRANDTAKRTNGKVASPLRGGERIGAVRRS